MTTNNAWNSQNPAQESVGGTNQSTYAQGDILYASAANTLSKLPIGQDGTILTVSAGVPSWGPGEDHSLIFIKQVVGSNDRNLDITGAISATYRNYWMFVTQMKPASTSNTARIRISDDAGATYKDGASDYSYYLRRNRTGDGDLAENFNDTRTRMELTINGEVRSSSGTGGNYWIQIFDPYSTTSKTRFSWMGNYLHEGTSYSCHVWGSGMYNTAARTDAFRLSFQDGNMDTCWVSIYGIKS